MRERIVKIAILAVLLVAASFITYRVVVGIWGVDDKDATITQEQGTGSTEVNKTKIHENLLTAYYYDDYAKGVIRYAAVRVFNVDTKECNYLFFPGNTKITLSDDVYQTISAASTNVKQTTRLSDIASCFAQDEDRYHFTTLALADVMGTKIPYYEAVSSDNIEKIVNLLDPVSFDVPQKMTFKDDSNTRITLKKGAQKLQGNQVKGMLTKPELYRSEQDRLRCSEQYVKAYMTAVVSIKDREQAGTYYSNYYGLVSSNGGFNVMRDYVDALVQIRPSNIVMTTVPGKNVKADYVVNAEKLQSVVKSFMKQAKNAENTADEEATTAEKTTEKATKEEATTEEEVTTEEEKATKEEATTEEKKDKDKKATTEEKKEADSKKLKIEIYNSTSITGLAARWKDYLKKEGYTITATETEKRYHLTECTIFVSKKGLGKDLKKYFPKATIKVGTLPKADIRIVLGTNDKTVGK